MTGLAPGQAGGGGRGQRGSASALPVGGGGQGVPGRQEGVK